MLRNQKECNIEAIKVSDTDQEKKSVEEGRRSAESAAEETKVEDSWLNLAASCLKVTLGRSFGCSFERHQSRVC